MKANIRKHIFSGIGISLIAGILLSILAPYHTGRLSFPTRFTYWTVLCLFGGFGAGAFLPLAKILNWNVGTAGQIIGQSITASLLVSAMLIGWNVYHSSHVDIPEALMLFFFVWVIGISITVIVHLSERATDPNLIQQDTRPQIFERLKPKYRNAEIYALMAEDHYVRVITSKGDDLILMRLSDAIKELGQIKGLSVHRSWWVAEAGVDIAKKTEGKISVELKSGQIAPVSRSKAKEVKAAGWI